MSEYKSSRNPSEDVPLQGRLAAAEANLRMVTESRELSINVLTLLNARTLEMGVIGRILEMIKEFTGLESLGIRLRQGDDYPYRFTTGFPEEFVDAENSLCSRDECGEIIREANGKPVFGVHVRNSNQGRYGPFPCIFHARRELLDQCAVEAGGMRPWDRG